MSRGLSTSITTELAKPGFRLATLLEINVGASTSYLTDYGTDVFDIDAQLYLSGANIIEIGDVRESGALKVNSISLTMTGAEQSFIAAFLGGDYIDRQVKIRRALMDGDDDVIDSFLFFDGRIVTYSIEDTERESAITIEVASHWQDFEKLKNRRTNLNSQQVYFPSDMGFQYASKITKDLRWGRKS